MRDTDEATERRKLQSNTRAHKALAAKASQAGDHVKAAELSRKADSFVSRITSIPKG